MAYFEKRNYLLNNNSHATIMSEFRGLGSPRNWQIRRNKAAEQKVQVVARQ